MQCPLCLEQNNEPYHRDKLREYQHCLVCDLVFVPANYYLSAEDEKARYNLHFNNPNDDGYKQFLMQLAAPMFERLKPDAAGLDFGSGPEPALAALFRARNFNTTLFDPFFANNQQVLKQQYNYITSSEVVEHLHAPAQVFSQLVQLLTSGGILGVMTKMQVSKTAFANWWYKNDPTHVCFYSDKTFHWITKKWKLHIEYCKGDVTIFRKL